MVLDRLVRGVVVLVALAVMVALAASAANARPAYAMKEGVACAYCHIAPAVGINFRGLYYRAHNHSFAEFDNVYEAKAAGVSPDSMAGDAEAKTANYPDVKVPPALNFVVKDIDGKTVHLARYQGSVILIVNVASFSSNTPQYAALEKLYEKYKDKGFVILGFPANAFNQQEPGDNKTIKEFYTRKYRVTFPMFSKIVVKGDGQAPLYKYLTDKKTDPLFSGDLDGSFAKFLLGRNGEIVHRFKASADPLKSPDIPDAIEKELAIPPETASNRASSRLFAAERNSAAASMPVTSIVSESGFRAR
jgi:glutathione peroxidase